MGSGGPSPLAGPGQSPGLIFDSPPSPLALLLLAHGAGAPMDSDFMTEIAREIAARGIAVARFEFPYMARRRAEGGKRPPDRMPVLLETFAAAAAEARRAFPQLPLVIGGKSMGGRAAAMAAAAIAPAGVVCLGYPFHPAGKAASLTPDSPRLAPLLAPPCPVLIVQGERDALGDRATVAALPLPPAVRLVWSRDGDHSLKPRKSAGLTAREAISAAAAAVTDFIERMPR